jgi:hypothetical protein
MRSAFLVLLGTIALAGTSTGADAQTAAPSCHGSQQSKTIAELLFGRDIGHRVGVSESDWARFAARALTPRFPDGLTVTDALGQWRDREGGGIVREPSKHVEIVLSGNPDDDARLDAAVAAYKHTFRQQSVALIVHTACVSF